MPTVPLPPPRWQLRARIGPFECSSSRRYSEFLQLQTRLKKAFKRQLLPPTAHKLWESKLDVSHQLQVRRCPSPAVTALPYCHCSALLPLLITDPSSPSSVQSQCWFRMDCHTGYRTGHTDGAYGWGIDGLVRHWYAFLVCLSRRVPSSVARLLHSP